MKRNRLFLVVFSFILTIIGIVTVTYAWVINSVDLPSVYIKTEGVKYNCNITNGVNQVTGNLDNVSFFDITDINETPYFLDMAKVVTLNMRNTGDIKLSYEVTQDQVNTNNPYLLLFFSDRLLTASDLTNTTLESFYSTHNSLTGTINKFNANNTNDNFTFYVYVIGVVPSTINNNDFLLNNYSFTINMKGVGVND